MKATAQPNIPSTSVVAMVPTTKGSRESVGMVRETSP